MSGNAQQRRVIDRAVKKELAELLKNGERQEIKLPEVEEAQPKPPKRDKATAFKETLKALFFVLLGAVITVPVESFVVDSLPPHKVFAAISALRPLGGNGKGCVFYHAALVSDDPLESFYFTLHFPAPVDDFRFGSAFEHDFSLNGPKDSSSATYSFTEMTKDPSLGCHIVQAAGLTQTEDIYTQRLGENIITVRSNNKTRNSYKLEGTVAMKDSSAAKVVIEGSYEYTVLGHLVRKPLTFIDKGVADAK